MSRLLPGILACCVYSSCMGNTASHYLETGNAYAKAGNFEAAVIQYRNASQKEPGLAEAHFRLGLVKWKLGRMAEAEGALRQALVLAPGHAEANAKLADLYISAYVSKPASRKNISEQLQTISKRLLDRDPDSYHGLRIRGYLAMADQKPMEAVELFRRAGAATSAAPETIIALTQSLFQAGQLAEAEKLSLSLLAEHKDFPAAYDNLYVQYIAAKRLNHAEAVLRRKVANFRDVGDYLIQLATFQDRYKHSSSELEQTLRVLTSDRRRFPAGPLLVADFHDGRGRAGQAIAALEEGLRESSPEKQQYLKRLVNIHLQQGNKELARAAIRTLTHEASGDEDVLAMQAILGLDSGRPEDTNSAVRELSELVRKAPDNPQFRLFLGHAFRARGDFDAARTHYLEAAGKRSEWTPPRMALVELSLARGEFMEALRYVHEIASYGSLDPRLRLFRSIARVGAGYVQNAKGELTKLAKEFPEHPEPQLGLGFIDLAEGRPKAAEERFKRLYRPGQKDLRALGALVEVRIAQRQIDEAIRLLEEELSRSDNSIGIRRLLARTEARAGHTENAIQHYRRLIAENVTSFDVLFALGELYQKQSDHVQALEFLHKTQGLAPRDPKPPIWIGFSYEQLGRMEEARKSYELGLNLDPGNPLALNNLANLLSETGEPEEALRLAKQAVNKVPDHPEFLDTLGRIYLKKRLPESAVQIFQDLVKRYPSAARFRYGLALALLGRGDEKQARVELEKALSGRPSEELSRKMRELLQRIS